MRRAFRVLFKTVLGLLSVVVLVYFLRGPLFGRAIADAVAEQLGAALGGRFTIHRIEGDWLREISVVGLRTAESPPDGALTRLECGRATVRYSLFRVLDGDYEGAVKGIRLSNGVVELDLTRPAAPPADGEPGQHPLDALPESLPALNLEASVSVRTESDAFALDLAVAGAGNAFDVEVGGIEVAEIPELERFLGRVQRAGPRSFLVTSEKEVEGVTVRAVNVHVPDEGWKVDALLDAAGGTIDVRADPAGLEATLRGLDIQRLPRVESPVAGRIREARVATKDFETIDFSVALTDVRNDDVHVTLATVDGAWRDGKARLRSVKAEAEQARLLAVGLVVDPDAPYVLASLERAEIAIDDLRAYVPELRHAVSVTTGALRMDGRGVEAPSLRVEGADSSFELALRATLPPAPEAWRNTTLDVRFRGRVGDLNRLARDLPRIEGGIDVSGTAGGTIAEPVATVTVDGRGIVVDGRAVESVKLAGRVDWPRLDGFGLEVVAPSGRLALKGNADLERRTVKDGGFEFDITDLASFLALFPGAPPAQGRLRGSGDVVWDGARAVGKGALEGDDLVYSGVALGRVEADATLAGDEVTLDRLEARGAWGWAKARGWLDRAKRTARVESVEGKYERWAGRLARPVDVRWDARETSVTGLDIAALGGRVHGSLRLGDVVVADLRAENIHLDEVDDRFRGRADLVIEARGDDYAIDLTAPQIAFEGRAGRLALKAKQDPRGIEIERIECQLGDDLVVQGNAVLPYRFEDERFVRVEGRAPRVFLDAVVRDVARFTGVAAANATVRLDGNEEGVRGEITVRDLALRDDLVLAGDTTFRVSASPAGVSAALTAAPNDLAEFGGRVALDRGVDWTRPEALEALYEDAQVEGSVTVDVPDLSLLRRLLTDVRALKGRAGVNLTLGGPLRAPNVHGAARLAGVTCFFEGDLPPVQEVEGALVLDGRTVRIDRLAGLLGYEAISVGGTLTFPAGETPLFNLKVQGGNVQLVRDRYLRLRADVDVGLAGPLDKLHVSGKVHVTDALYSKPVDFLAKSGAAADAKFQLFSIRDGPFRKMTLDVAITADESFRVRNNLLRGAFSTDLKLRGTGEVPEPTGRVFCRDVLVRLPASSLKIDQAELRFPVDNPFVPSLQAAGHTRKRGYEVNVQVSGQMPDFLVYVSTTPSLPQDDAILLLTTGATRADLEQEGIERAALTRVGAYFGERLVSRVSGPEDPDQASFLDRFSFEVGANVTRNGKETYTGEFEISRRWYLRGERDRFDDYNAGIVWRLRFR